MIDKAHVVGISMGGFATLHFGFAYPGRALSLVVAGCGYGAEPGKRQQFQTRPRKTIALIEGQGMGEASKFMRRDPAECSFKTRTRVAGRVRSKTRRAFDQRFGVDDAWRPGAATVIMGSDRSDGAPRGADPDHDRRRGSPCLEPGIMMKRTIPTAALIVFPNTGHALNLEEPDLFNRTLDEFFIRRSVGGGRAATRAP